MTRYTAFIPVRAGSKSIPDKNIRQIAGRPLVHWAIKAADECPQVGRIVVSTDSADIEAVAVSFGSSKLEIHHRSADSATDIAGTEQVMLEYARDRDDFDVMVLIQATSPLLEASDLGRGCALIDSGSCDSVLSVVRQKRFLWTAESGRAEPLNYDFRARPRRQDFDGFLVENGAFYMTSRAALIETGCRLSGRVDVVEMDEAGYFEIDEPADWDIVERLLERKAAPGAPDPDSLAGIKAVFTDCDGVLTDGGMYYSEAGDETKKFQTRDGVGLAMLKSAGIITGIITSESVRLVERRAAKLGLDECLLGAKDKLAAVDGLCAKYSLTREQVAYVGDDVMDVAAIRAVGLGCTVSDGRPEAKAAADYVTRAGGGEGAVREIAELILGS